MNNTTCHYGSASQERVGSIYLDYFNLYPFTVISVLGFALNLGSYVIFNHREFHNMALYSFFRSYCLNNSLLCFLSIFNFTYSTARLISWSSSYPAQFYYNYVFIPIQGLSYFYSNVIEVFILFDRVHKLKGLKRFKSLATWMSTWPHKTMIISFLICLLLELPYFFIFRPGQMNVCSNSTVIIVWVSQPTKFHSFLSKFLVLGVYSFRDLIVAIAQIILNGYSLYLLKRYLKQKKLKLAPVTLKPSMLSNTLENSYTAVSNTEQEKYQPPVRTDSQMSAVDQRATLMSALVCLLSVIEHFITLIAFSYAIFYTNLFTLVLDTIYNFALPLKRLLDVGLFYFFNLKFRNRFQRQLSVWRRSR